MYFLNSHRTLCHILEDMRTGEAPDPCGAKARKFDLRCYQEGKPNNILSQKPADVPLCKHCEKALAWMRDAEGHILTRPETPAARLFKP